MNYRIWMIGVCGGTTHNYHSIHKATQAITKLSTFLPTSCFGLEQKIDNEWVEWEDVFGQNIHSYTKPTFVKI